MRSSDRKFKQWVVIDPDGNVVWSEVLRWGHRVFDYKKDAMDVARTYATWDAEREAEEKEKKKGRIVSCDWDDLTWTETRKRGFNVKLAELVLK